VQRRPDDAVAVTFIHVNDVWPVLVLRCIVAQSVHVAVLEIWASLPHSTVYACKESLANDVSVPAVRRTDWTSCMLFRINWSDLFLLRSEYDEIILSRILFLL
jgi:hypothetical protein